MPCSRDNDPEALLLLPHVIGQVSFRTFRILGIVSIVVPQRYDSPQAFLLQFSGLLQPLPSVQLWPLPLSFK